MRNKLVPSVIVFVLFVPVLTRWASTWDYEQHFRLIGDLARLEQSPPHPLFHLAVIALTGGDQPAAVPGVAACLLALAPAVRTWLTASLLSSEGGCFSILKMTVICLLLAVAMPIPYLDGQDPGASKPSPDVWLVGQPSPNIWHNPTFIFAAPFALGLFVVAMHLCDEPTPGTAVLTGVAMALSLLAKPNYVLAFVPCFGPTLSFILLRDWWRGAIRGWTALVVLSAAFMPALGVLAAQALWLQNSHPVGWWPWYVWGKYSSNFAASILLGTAYPLLAVVCYLRQVSEDRGLLLSWGTFGVAIATFATLYEPGIAYHANWGWGMHLANSVLFVVTTAFVLRQRPDWRRWICLGTLGAHAAVGVYHLFPSPT